MSGFSKDFWDFWAKVVRKSLNLSLFSVVFIALAFSACNKKHTPQSKESSKSWCVMRVCILETLTQGTFLI